MRAETEAALAAMEAGLSLARRRDGADQITSKGGRDLVTATDVAVEDAIRATLCARFPSWTVVGEERGGEDQISDAPYWLVDPICGTGNFAADLPLYAVNVALAEGGRVTVAAVGDGGTGARYVAERGRGAYRVTSAGLVRLRASAETLILNVSAGASKPGIHQQQGARFIQAAILADRWEVRMLATTAAFAYLAAGKVAANVLFRLSSPVHSAAGCLLAEEAGALVTDLHGQPWTLETRALLMAATPELHRELRDLLAATLG